MAKNDWGDEVATEETGKDWGDKLAAQGDLPAGVTPSSAGGGRGSVNPPAAGPAQPQVPWGAAGDPVRTVAPRESVLEGMTLAEPEFNQAAAAHLSRRANVDVAPPSRISLSDARPTASRRMADAGAALQDSSMPVRMIAKAATGAAQGGAGLVRAGAEAVGAHNVAEIARLSGAAADDFEKGMGTTKPVEGFGPKSPVPYVRDMAEGAGASLLTTGATASMFGARAVIPLLSIQSAGAKYDEARNAGLEPGLAFANAVPTGIFEAVGEKFQGLDKAASAIGVLMNKGASPLAKRTAADMLVRSGIKEIPGEVVTYLGQSATDLLPGIGIKQDMTVGQFLDGLRDTVVQAGMMGSVQVAGGAAGRNTAAGQPSAEQLAKGKGFLVPEARVKQLADAGEKEVAGVLQRRNDAEAADRELPALAGKPFAADPDFQQRYRQLRTEGVKPAEAGARAAMLSGFGHMGGQTGLSPKAIEAAAQKAATLPLDKIPDFLDKFTAKLIRGGMGQPLPDGTIAGAVSALGDEAMSAAMDTVYADTPAATVDAIKALENAGTGAADAQKAGSDAVIAPPAPQNTDFDPGNDVPVSGVDAGAHDAAASPLNDHPEPTKAQILAGNAKLGHARVGPLRISVETPSGAFREDKAHVPPKWRTEMKGVHYGYVKRTEAADSTDAKRQGVDIFLKEGLPEDYNGPVYVVDQVDRKGVFDEHKALAGPTTEAEATQMYLGQYDKGWTGLGAITEFPTVVDFNKWVKAGKKTDPASPSISSRAAAPAGDKLLSKAEQPEEVEGAPPVGELSTAQVAARAKAAARLGLASTSPKGEPIHAHGFIAGAGGLSRETMADVGFDRNVRVGNRTLFAGKGKGLTLEQATLKLIQDGYLPEGASHTDTANLIAKSLKTPQYNPDGWARVGEAAATTRFEDHLAAQEEAEDPMGPVTDYSDAELEAAGYAAASDEVKAEVQALLALAEDRGIDTETIREDASRLTSDQPEQAYYDAAKAALENAIQGGRGDLRTPAGEQGRSATVVEKPGEANRDPEGPTPSTVSEPTETPAPAGVSVSGPTWIIRSSGTLAVKGDPDAIREKLKDIPRKHLMMMQGGIMVGKTQAAKAQAILEDKPTAPAAAKPLTMGIAPGSADPVTVKDGVVFIGKYEAVDFDSGEPITVPAGASDAQVKKALQDGGALTKKQRFFGGSAESQTPAIPLDGKNELLSAPTVADVLSKQERAAAGESAEKAAKADEAAKAKADAERGEFTLTGSDRPADVGAAGGQKPMFSRGPAADPLEALSKVDELYRYGKSDKTTIEGIVADLDPSLKVRTTDVQGETMHTISLPGGRVARITVRDPGKSSEQVYGYDISEGGFTPIKKRPGTNPQDVRAGTGDVWVDVSNMLEGTDGAAIYNIAANLAHNTGRIFIGDPSGLSDTALRRRTEQMLSSALKFGTTKHLAPHPRQETGDTAQGVPPLRWTYGDDVGNIQSLIQVSLEAFDNADPNPITFEPGTGRFVDRAGDVVDDDAISSLAAEGSGRTARAGVATLKRNAILRSLAREGSGTGSERGGSVLADLLDVASQPGSAARRVFYSRGGSSGLSPADGRRAVDALKANGLRKLQLVDTIEGLPESGKSKIKSEGATGVRGMFDPDTDTTYLVRENLTTIDDAFWVGLHEAFHRGLRKTFGSEVEPILTLIHDGNERVRLAAARYQERYKIGRSEAIEEVLADMAGNGVAGDLKGWEKLLDFLRRGLDKIAKAMGIKVTFTDQMITNLVAGVRKAGMQDEVQLETGEPPSAANFRTWFGGSKVVDADGKPLVVYHGTNKSQDGDAFTQFDSYGSNYGLFGQGAYFTENAEVASSYVRKGRGDAPTVYPAYMKLTNPIDMDAKANDAAWRKAFNDVDFDAFEPAGETNEAYYRAAEEDLTDREIPRYEGAEIMQDGLRRMGHDGITHIGGGRVKSEGVRHKVFIAFDPEQIKSATGNSGSFDGGNADIRFNRTRNLFEPDPWTVPAMTRTDRVIYELQDGRVDLKRVQQAIKGAGREIDEKFDPRLAETLYPGRVARRSEQFLDAEVKPLLEAMAKNGATMTELGDYLIARHAAERNAQVAKVNPALPDGGAGRNSKGELMTNDAAADYLAGLPADRRALMHSLARKVDAITKGTRHLLVVEGLEKADTVAAWEGAYANYVPLFKDETEHPHPQGMGFTVKGPASKRATGSTKEVTNVIAHVLMQREAAITRAEKNRVGLALYGLALSHPNPAFWTTIKPGMTNEAIGEELESMGVDPSVAVAGMERVPTVRTVDKLTNKVVDRPNPIYKNMPGAIVLKVDGEDRVLMLNTKDPRALRMAEALKNLDGLTQIDLAGSIIGKTTRWLAAINTQYNPAFGLVNLVRDTLGGSLNLGSTALKGKTLQVLAHVPAAMQGIARELSGGGENSEWSKLWKQFQDDGGKTGYREVFAVAADRAKAIESELAAAEKAGKLTPGKVGHAMLDLLDGFNTTLENAVRLAAYKSALDKGLSRAAAARLGRELTVDFNRKGRAGREIGPLFAFFNASVQGGARTIEALKGPTGAKIIAGGLALGAIQALLLAAMGYDDDEIPEFVKTRSLIIPLPTGDSEKRFVSIPYPLGLHVIPNTGRVLTELTLNGGKDVGKRVVSAIGEILSAFNPLGGGNIFTADGALKTIAPTVVDPLIEIGYNRNFAGGRIERESPRGETDSRPGYQRAKESTLRSTTGQAYLGISKALNALTGGTAYEAGAVSPTPERVRYIAQTAGGGVLREIEKTIDSSVKAARGEKVRMSGIPVAGRFYGEVDADQVQQSRYYERGKQLDKVQSSLAAAKAAGDGEAMVRMIEANPDALLIKAHDKIQRDLAKLNKLAVSTVNDTATIKAIDEARLETMRSLNTVIKEMEDARTPPTLAQKLRGAVRKPEVAAQ